MNTDFVTGIGRKFRSDFPTSLRVKEETLGEQAFMHFQIATRCECLDDLKIEIPLSPALSPLVPHGARVS